MSALVAVEYVSLDGVVQAPGRPEARGQHDDRNGPLLLTYERLHEQGGSDRRERDPVESG